jgi:hypothetical protein
MNLQVKHVTPLLAALLALSLSSSFAQTDRRGELRALDTNKDKLISRQEATPNTILSKNFDAIDANKDGQLSRDELKANRKAHQADQDGDGNISKAEAANKPQLVKHFDQMDINKDGVLTPAERKAWMAQRKG